MFSAKYGDYLASLFGASIVAFGLGVLLADYFSDAVWLLIIAGTVLHGWGMYGTHVRNRA